MILLETLGRRWFAFAFIATFFWAAWPEGGWRRAARFLAIASGVSFLAEYASTHTGFPYGRYDYIAHTRGDEVYLSNVPLFVPLSFGTVVWAGYAFAAMLAPGFVRRPYGAHERVVPDGVAAPLRPARATLRLVARASVFLVLAGAACATLIDFVIDPMTLRGNTWFLGELYAFRAGGPYFDIPWSNFGGWLLVSAVIIAIDQALGIPGGARRSQAIDLGRTPRRLALPFGMMGFFVVLALATRHWTIAATSGAITLGAAALLVWADRRSGRLRADTAAAAR